MRTSSGIYVEIEIQDDLDHVWLLTQDPAFHERWDLRFSRIHYLPRSSSAEPQQFLYETRIGFGLSGRYCYYESANDIPWLPEEIPIVYDQFEPPVAPRRRGDRAHDDAGAIVGADHYCALIATQDAAAELHASRTTLEGDKAPTSTPGNPAKLQCCKFSTPGAIPDTLSINFEIVSSAAVAHQAFQARKQILEAMPQKLNSVSGIGDEAMMNPDGQLLFFCKDAICVQLQGGADPLKFNDTSDRLRAFATKLAAKLP
ncbi:hypothetical protein [Edaphobacter aggregans]|uniref:hypothetical protein n=1 Tax=Edaphobacter aggregans TaxID=570835 RepID=UPI00054FF5B9|nr:hypothetical protein [Edaphobacter aggregans]